MIPAFIWTSVLETGAIPGLSVTPALQVGNGFPPFLSIARLRGGHGSGSRPLSPLLNTHTWSRKFPARLEGTQAAKEMSGALPSRGKLPREESLVSASNRNKEGSRRSPNRGGSQAPRVRACPLVPGGRGRSARGPTGSPSASSRPAGPSRKDRSFPGAVPPRGCSPGSRATPDFPRST